MGISRNIKQRLAQLLMLLLFANPGMAAAAAAATSPTVAEKPAETAEPVTFTVEKPTKEATGETATSLNESPDLSASGKRISDQEKLNSFGNRLLAYYIQRGQKGGPSWLKTTDIQLRFTQDNQPLYSFETIQPFGDIRKDGSLWFWQGRYAHLNLDNGSTANLGFGWRKLSEDKTSLVGLNLFYDYGFQYDLQRVGLGAEYFHNQMEYRFNYYYPVSGDKQTGLEVQSGGILYSYIRAVEGFDYELGTSLPKAPWWKVYAGGYHWDNKYNPDETGIRLRSNMQLTPRVAVEIGYQSSNLASGNLYGKISYQLADALGPAFWGSLPTVDGKPIPVLVQLYRNGKPIGEPILVNAAKLTDRFTAKATPVNPSDLALKDKNDLSANMLQKIERNNDIKTEKFTKFVPYPASSTGSASITVTNASSTPINGATVTVTIGSITYLATTNLSGVASFASLPVGGPYTFTAAAANYVSNTAPVTISASGGSGAIALTSSIGNASITVYKADGTTPISGASVSLTVGSATQTATTTGSGVATFSGLAVGTYNWTASATGYVTSGTQNLTVASSGGTASVNLSQQTYTISAATGSNGTISPSGDISVPYGGYRTFTFQPNTNCYISSVTVDGVSISTQIDSYTFTQVAANHTLSVSYSVPSFTLKVTNVTDSGFGLNIYVNGSYVSHLAYTETFERKVANGSSVEITRYTSTLYGPTTLSTDTTLAY